MGYQANKQSARPLVPFLQYINIAWPWVQDLTPLWCIITVTLVHAGRSDRNVYNAKLPVFPQKVCGKLRNDNESIDSDISETTTCENMRQGCILPQ